MSHSISPQHPAVVLRSHYLQMRALLAIALIAVVGLTVAVVILARGDAGGTSASSEARVSTPAPAAPGQRYDGGPEEGTRGLAPRDSTPSAGISTPSAGIRYDGGPEEGISGIQPSSAATSTSDGIRYDGGPEEGTSGLRR